MLQNFRIALLAAGLAIVSHLLDATLQRQAVGPVPHAFGIALALVAWAALTAPLSYWPGGSVAQLIDPFLKAIAFFWLIGSIVTTPGRLRLFTWVVVLCGIPLSLSALQSYQAGDFLVTPVPSVQRITGFNAGFSGVAGNPNDLALTLNLIIPLAGALCITEKSMLARAVAALTLVLAIAGVVVTFSRAGFLALAAILLSLVIAAVRRAPGVALTIVLVLALLTPALLPSGYTQRLTTIADISRDPTGSAQGRWADLAVAADLVTSNPVFGVGLGQNVLALNRERGATWREVHNAYLQYALDLGVPGLLLFLWLFIAVFRSAGRVRRLAQRVPALRTLGTFAECAQMALTAFAIAALFYPVAYYFYFFLIGGLAIAIANVCRTQVASGLETATTA